MKQIKFLLLLVLLAGCYNVREYPEPAIDWTGSHNATVLETRYLSHNGNEMWVEMDIAAFYDGVNLKEDISIGDSAFKDRVFPLNNIKVEEVKRLYLEQDKPYSNLVLLDLSDGHGIYGSWREIDYYNYRTMSLNRNFKEAAEAGNNETAIASFTRKDGTGLHQTWIWKEGTPFSQTYEEKAKILLFLYEKTGGSSNVYDALDHMIDYVKDNAAGNNKNITLITHALPDALNKFTYQQIQSKALAAGVKINLISLSSTIHWNHVAMASNTGGFVNIISSTSQYTLSERMKKGATMLSAIHRVMSGNLHVYRLKLKLTRLSGNWQSGQNVFNYYELNEKNPDGTNRINNFIPVYVKVP